MSIPFTPLKVKLFFSIFSKFSDRIDTVRDIFKECYGPMDFETPFINFDNTNYYEKEFGSPLFRKIFSFEKNIMPNEIVAIKHKAYEIENKFSENNKRTVNIDPGYVSLTKVVLSTGKDFIHRIYLDNMVYADLTLIYKKGEGFTPLVWSYPDYSSNMYRKIFFDMRTKLKSQLDAENKG